MKPRVKSERPYRSPRREEQARETQQRILEAARELFVRRGYAGTTVSAIAKNAGVAPETVFAIFQSKRTILARLVGTLVGGDERSTPLLERVGPQKVRREVDQRRQMQLFAWDIREILERVGPIMEVVGAAALTEPEIADLERTLQKTRLRNMTQMVRWVAANGPLRTGLQVSEAADIVWTLASAEVHRLLTAERHWSGQRYEQWLAETLAVLLLPTNRD